MVALRSLLSRVQRLEHAKADRFVWVDELEEVVRASLGTSYDELDMAIVLPAVQRWRRDQWL